MVMNAKKPAISDGCGQYYDIANMQSIPCLDNNSEKNVLSSDEYLIPANEHTRNILLEWINHPTSKLFIESKNNKTMVTLNISATDLESERWFFYNISETNNEDEKKVAVPPKKSKPPRKAKPKTKIVKQPDIKNENDVKVEQKPSEKEIREGQILRQLLSGKSGLCPRGSSLCNLPVSAPVAAHDEPLPEGKDIKVTLREQSDCLVPPCMENLHRGVEEEDMEKWAREWMGIIKDHRVPVQRAFNQWNLLLSGTDYGARGSMRSKILSQVVAIERTYCRSKKTKTECYFQVDLKDKNSKAIEICEEVDVRPWPIPTVCESVDYLLNNHEVPFDSRLAKFGTAVADKDIVAMKKFTRLIQGIFSGGSEVFNF